MRHLLLAVSLTILFAAPPLAMAQDAGNSRTGVISPAVASRFGLKRAWFTQIEVDRSRGRVVHLTQHVSEKRFYNVFEITTPQGVQYITEREVDRWGKPLGVEGAEKLAKELVKELKEQKVAATLKPLQVPEITLYAQTDRGTLHALDGTTGKTKWVVSVGNAKHPSLEPGANDKFVAVINGSYLYVLDSTNGSFVWKRQIDGTPGAGPSLTDDRVFVPTVSGKMEAYLLEDYRRPPWYFQSTGSLMVQPTVSDFTVSWVTDRGVMYVSNKVKPKDVFRIESRKPAVVPTAILPNRKIYFASTDGYIRCVDEVTEEIVWRMPIGDMIIEPMIATRENIYVVSDESGIYCFGSPDGTEHWWAPRIRKLLAATKDRVYCVDHKRDMVILDARTGGQIDSMPIPQLDFLFTNAATDRIIVGTSTGMLQCLHEAGATWPTIHIALDPEETKKPDVIQKVGDDKPVVEKPEDGEDPFGGGAKPDDDPFGGAAEPADDPFGGGADEPADDGGAEKPAADDPFGGGAADDEDPFAG